MSNNSQFSFPETYMTIELHLFKNFRISQNWSTGKLLQPDEKEIATYFRVYILPDTSNFKLTQIISRTFSPQFNAAFTFKCLIDDLDKSEILLRLYQHHKLIRDMPIGDAIIGLSKSNLPIGLSTVPMFAYNPALDDPLGEICFSIRYNPFKSKLTVTIMECRNLKAMDWNSSSDPYVKVVVIMQEKVVYKKKTDVKKGTLCPYFNTSFSVKVVPTKLQIVDLRVIVKDWDIVGGNDEIGGVRLGLQPDSEIAERQWNNMVENPKKPQTEWHYLLPIEE